MNSNDLSIARSFKHLVQKRVNPINVRVFGSRARGDATPDSDMDVFVDHATSDIERYVSECAWDPGFERDVVIVPVVVPAYSPGADWSGSRGWRRRTSARWFSFWIRLSRITA